MAQTKTKLCMSALVPAGLPRPIENQIPTPVTVPAAAVSTRKKREWRLSRGIHSARPWAKALRSAMGRKSPPPTAKCEIRTWMIAMIAMTHAPPKTGTSQTG